MDFDQQVKYLREAQATIQLVARDMVGKFVDSRKMLVRRAAKSKSDWKIINEHGYNITQAEIDYVKELDTKGSGHTAHQS